MVGSVSRVGVRPAAGAKGRESGSKSAKDALPKGSTSAKTNGPAFTLSPIEGHVKPD